MFLIYKKICGEWVFHKATYYETCAEGECYQLEKFFGFQTKIIRKEG
jgi:hypothetical protein